MDVLRTTLDLSQPVCPGTCPYDAPELVVLNFELYMSTARRQPATWNQLAGTAANWQYLLPPGSPWHPRA